VCPSRPGAAVLYVQQHQLVMHVEQCWPWLPVSEGLWCLPAVACRLCFFKHVPNVWQHMGSCPDGASCLWLKTCQQHAMECKECDAMDTCLCTGRAV
jgi:hypothetical protein